MNATYYAIYKLNKELKEKEEIVLEGIIRSYEDTIYPQQETGIEGLPFECEACKFRSQKDYLGNTYVIEIYDFEITRDYVKENRIP